jgi:hypothetical protein
VGGNPHRLAVELRGGSLIEHTPFEPDATTFRGTYYYNTARNELYKKEFVVGKDGTQKSFWRSITEYGHEPTL